MSSNDKVLLYHNAVPSICIPKPLVSTEKKGESSTITAIENPGSLYIPTYLTKYVLCYFLRTND